ncbi:superoxide dismutase [Cu-Zn], chloroplastic [Aedes aegypti]|uniref:Superoxide dismutase [Cu-Zn] n=1 Tax=Aedes aegypti TaxID=7159 RepID=A0A6I8TDP3_AEDAE|nr:superoxide dismutase [Cu-Zn], chloroplastic [Aedes aegypti]
MKVLIVLAVVSCLASVYAEQSKKAIVFLQGTSGVSGNVTLSQPSCTEPVLIEVSIIGLSPGKHGFHIHERGDLSDGCTSTGGHYNPDKVTHGGPADQVRHIGDLGNVVADENGIAKTSFSDTVVSLFGSYSVLGRAIVVHAGVDDFGKTNHPDSLKTGNAGGRLACGIIGILSPFDEPEQLCSGGQSIRPIHVVLGLMIGSLIVRALGY